MGPALAVAGAGLCLFSADADVPLRLVCARLRRALWAWSLGGRTLRAARRGASKAGWSGEGGCSGGRLARPGGLGGKGTEHTGRPVSSTQPRVQNGAGHRACGGDGVGRGPEMTGCVSAAGGGGAPGPPLPQGCAQRSPCANVDPGPGVKVREVGLCPEEQRQAEQLPEVLAVQSGVPPRGGAPRGERRLLGHGPVRVPLQLPRGRGHAEAARAGAPPDRRGPAHRRGCRADGRVSVPGGQWRLEVREEGGPAARLRAHAGLHAPARGGGARAPGPLPGHAPGAGPGRGHHGRESEPHQAASLQRQPADKAGASGETAAAFLTGPDRVPGLLQRLARASSLTALGPRTACFLPGPRGGPSPHTGPAATPHAAREGEGPGHRRGDGGLLLGCRRLPLRSRGRAPLQGRLSAPTCSSGTRIKGCQSYQQSRVRDVSRGGLHVDFILR
ncbi:dol-P-Man:Man(7)GlcNAc(2)-PP-Dol alpha-1,6-mannosyltransferase isoform 2-T2 [Glossophaga mutica]